MAAEEESDESKQQHSYPETLSRYRSCGIAGPSSRCGSLRDRINILVEAKDVFGIVLRLQHREPVIIDTVTTLEWLPHPRLQDSLHRHLGKATRPSGRWLVKSRSSLNDPNTGPAIVRAHLSGNVVGVEPVLAGNANAVAIPTDTSVELNLKDPDSMTRDPLGNIVLDSQADQELVIVSNPGTTSQTALQLPLSIQTSSGTSRVQVDDTNFTTSSQGFILFADKTLNVVYKLSRQAFPPNVAFTSANGASVVGTIDLNTGLITPVVTGLGNPGGLIFVDTLQSDRFPSYHQGGSSCEDRDGWGSLAGSIN